MNPSRIGRASDGTEASVGTARLGLGMPTRRQDSEAAPDFLGRQPIANLMGPAMSIRAGSLDRQVEPLFPLREDGQLRPGGHFEPLEET
jgi:hypothetical protein